MSKKPPKKIETAQRKPNADVSRNKKGGYHSETYEPQTQKEFGLGDSIREIGRVFRGKR